MDLDWGEAAATTGIPRRAPSTKLSRPSSLASLIVPPPAGSSGAASGAWQDHMPLPEDPETAAAPAQLVPGTVIVAPPAGGSMRPEDVWVISPRPAVARPSAEKQVVDGKLVAVPGAAALLLVGGPHAKLLELLGRAGDANSAENLSSGPVAGGRRLEGGRVREVGKIAGGKNDSFVRKCASLPPRAFFLNTGSVCTS